MSISISSSRTPGFSLSSCLSFVSWMAWIYGIKADRSSKNTAMRFLLQWDESKRNNPTFRMRGQFRQTNVWDSLPGVRVGSSSPHDSLGRLEISELKGGDPIFGCWDV